MSTKRKQTDGTTNENAILVTFSTQAITIGTTAPPTMHIIRIAEAVCVSFLPSPSIERAKTAGNIRLSKKNASIYIARFADEPRI